MSLISFEGAKLSVNLIEICRVALRIAVAGGVVFGLGYAIGLSQGRPKTPLEALEVHDELLTKQIEEFNRRPLVPIPVNTEARLR